MWVLIKYKEAYDDTVHEVVVPATSEDIAEDIFLGELKGVAVEVLSTEMFIFIDDLPEWYQEEHNLC